MRVFFLLFGVNFFFFINLFYILMMFYIIMFYLLICLKYNIVIIIINVKIDIVIDLF